jgi:hypothetical protein
MLQSAVASFVSLYKLVASTGIVVPLYTFNKRVEATSVVYGGVIVLLLHCWHVQQLFLIMIITCHMSLSLPIIIWLALFCVP